MQGQTSASPLIQMSDWNSLPVPQRGFLDKSGLIENPQSNRKVQTQQCVSVYDRSSLSDALKWRRGWGGVHLEPIKSLRAARAQQELYVHSCYIRRVDMIETQSQTGLCCQDIGAQCVSAGPSMSSGTRTAAGNHMSGWESFSHWRQSSIFTAAELTFL